ncbi:MAG: phenylalanine--tRNA ligase beta subunit-related protein [Bacteroidetes bacterium]|nr:phenylalanine--tRNA ligase beta subunit-related protein [Bacteroidota bacterium]
MIEIAISDQLKKLWPMTAVGCLQYFARVGQHQSDLWNEINAICDQIIKELSIEDIAHLPHVHDTREAYKAVGKKPSRYRVSSEALLRRIIQGKGLYKVNSIVDINNLVSILSHFSLGTFNLDKIQPPIEFDIGKENETYTGIGKGLINIEDLPVFRDTDGPFGSPTSDSERAMVTPEAERFLTVIISFSGKTDLNSTIDMLIDNLAKYSGGYSFDKRIVE